MDSGINTARDLLLKKSGICVPQCVIDRLMKRVVITLLDACDLFKEVCNSLKNDIVAPMLLA
jgi:hypothetical protein